MRNNHITPHRQAYDSSLLDRGLWKFVNLETVGSFETGWIDAGG
jgi:hypothetical protein